MNTLEQAAPVIETVAQDRAWPDEPERALLAREDDAIVGEFIAELTHLERQVFALVADGRSWRAIATALALPETQARRLTRVCERKRTRFLTLYSTGRLCGYRSQTIGALLAGKTDSEMAVGQAFAHLRHCHTCRTRYKTDAPSLRAAFDTRALAIMPLLPAHTTTHAAPSLLDQLQTLLSRIARFFQRFSTPQTGGVRERGLEVVAGTSAGAKLAAGIASVLLLAGGAVSAATNSPPIPHRRATHHPIAVRPLPLVRPAIPAGRIVARKPSPPPRRPRRLPRPSEQHTPGGFSYLGTPQPVQGSTATPVVSQHGGGPFGP